MPDFAAEWATELDGEADVPEEGAGYRLPMILSHRAVAELCDRGGLALRTLYAAGLRERELLALQRDDVRFDATLLVKGERPRVVPVDETTASALMELPDGLLFVEVREALRAAADASGIAARYAGCQRLLGPAALRHAYATHCLENGMDVVVVHQLLGHENLATTQQYFQTGVALRKASYHEHHPLLRSRGPDDEGGQATPTVAEVLRLVDAAETPRDRLLLRLYYATGMRRNELLNLRFLDVEREEQRLFVREGKEDKDRYVLADPETLRMLGDGPAGDELFGLGPTRVDAIFRHAAERTGLLAKYAAQGQKLSLHSLRHAFATHCYAHGMSLGVLKKLLGHAQLTTTILYLDCPFEQCLHSYQDSHELARE